MDSYENLDEATRKKIEELQKVTRESESDVKFSLAQIKLAEIFYKYGFFDEAVRVSNLIEPKDSYEHYQKAQYNIGAVYEEQGDTDAAIKIWSKMKEDSSEVYSRAQFNIGIILNDSGEFEDAKKAWGKVKRKGSPQTYAKAQFNIASRLFKEGKEDYAIRVWRNVEKDVYSEAYALAQFNIGVGLNRKGCIEDALDTWDNIEIENSLEIFNLAQYNIGTVSLENNTQSQYITRAENALKKIVNGYQYEKQCLEKICRLLKTSSTDVGKYLLLLFTHTTEIIKILKVDFSHRVTDNKPIERKLAHYTGTDTTNKLLDIEKGKEQPSSFRLNTINNVNDPSEGKLLLNYLKGVKGLSYNSQFDEDLHAFISCFTFNHDSLNQFRLYGKEGNKEASGISLVFKKDFFQKYYFIGGLSYVFFEDTPSSPKNTRNTAEISLREGKIEKQPVMRCVYIDPTSNYIHLAQRNRLTFFREFNDESVQIGSKTLSKAEYEWKSYKSFIDQKTEDFSIAFTDLQSDYRVIVKELIEIEKVNPSLSSKIQVLLNEIILPLKYLIKHSAFQEEQECRMVYMTSLDDKKVKMEFGKFLYVEYEADVRNNLDKIYIAPAATQYQPYLAKLLCKSQTKNKVRIDLSNNPYRQT